MYISYKYLFLNAKLKMIKISTIVRLQRHIQKQRNWQFSWKTIFASVEFESLLLSIINCDNNIIWFSLLFCHNKHFAQNGQFLNPPAIEKYLGIERSLVKRHTNNLHSIIIQWPARWHHFHRRRHHLYRF